MYLDTVLEDLRSTRALHSEHLYKLNEAMFNLPEEDAMDKKKVGQIYDVIENIRNMCWAGKAPKGDPNFFYDYLALLCTMHNQHLFSQKQTDSLLVWTGEAIEFAAEIANPDARKEPKGKHGSKDLEAQNKELKKEIQKLQKYKAMVDSSGDNGKGKSDKGKGKDWDDYYGHTAHGKGKDDSKGKTKGKGKEWDAYEAPAKGKGKDDARGKGKKGEGKGKDSGYDAKGAKGKGKGKKGKVQDEDDSDDDYAPAKGKKGKGKGKKGKAKGGHVEESDDDDY